MRLIITGPQGSGKGTQAQMLSSVLGIEHLSVGERLRREAASGSALGKRIKPILERGEIVPGAIVNQLVGKIVREARKGFILDGYPRTKEQVAFLDKTVEIDKAILLKIPDDRAVARLSGRLECANGHDYHITLKPPKKKGVCDACGLPLRKRTDDTKTAILKRLAIYHVETEPLLAHYAGKLLTVDADQSIAKVHQDIMKGLHRT
jgi:adenylate kinase